MSEWRSIETAPKDKRLRVSMRDVDREPPEWVACRITVSYRSRRWYDLPYEREYWIADDGLICQPTHWMPLSASSDRPEA
jgi:hypothetical protein